MNNLASLRGGMQVHAVPENERYVDLSGKRMPWAYERADIPEVSSGRREVVEKGPFGRRRRGTSRSRSKTAEPRREEDRIRIENTAAEDAIFGKLRVEPREKEKGAERTDGATATASDRKEPTEVLLYGFGDDLMWSAVDFYERASNGIILEDYERQPAGKLEPLARSLSRATAQKSLTRASLRRKNTFQGGRHWIKVTFDSAEAADLAVARSPHTVKGHLVYAEPFRGAGPARDESIFASNAGAQITSDNIPTTFATNTQDSPISDTVSSATVNGEDKRRPQIPPRMQIPTQSGHNSASSALQSPMEDNALVQRHGHIKGATRAILLPAEQAIMKRPTSSTTILQFGGGDYFTSAAPKHDDGTIDWQVASLYWRFLWYIDYCFGTNACGLKDD